MDTGDSKTGAGRPGDAPRDAATIARPEERRRSFGSQRIGEILGEWRPVELRIARSFAECRGLSTEQLEDLYHETLLVLYSRPYADEEHLRNALRKGIKQRALRLHRDGRRHARILARDASGLHLVAEDQQGQIAPEPAVLAREDGLIAKEFLTELNEAERRVFGWQVEGLSYRAVATALEISLNEARNLARACERKRERFQLLYDAGRLCGYRALTIKALQNGESTSEELAERAFAHLDNCLHCRLEHKTNAKRLRRSFRDQAAALLPPIMVSHLDWFTRLGIRARVLLHRLGIDRMPVGQGGARERAVALLASGGASAKIAVGVVTLGVLAGGAVATHVIDQSPPTKRRPVVRSSALAPPVTTLPAPHPRSTPASSPPTRTTAHRSVVHNSRHQRSSAYRPPSATRPPARSRAVGQREPGGFAYLGVPTTASQPAPAQPTQPAQAARVAGASEDQHSGGEFSP
jgi:RNA polymerase sigma factor (sigma-70 family)